MVQLLINNLSFCNNSVWVGVGYLNFRKDSAITFLSLLTISFFFSRKVSVRPRRAHIIDLSMSTQPTKNDFLPKFSCYNGVICSPLKIKNQAVHAPSRNETRMSLILIAGQRLKLQNYTASAVDIITKSMS